MKFFSAGLLFIHLSNDIDKTLTLVQQGIDSLMVTEIKQTLYRNYQIDIDAEDIQELTFEKLMQLGNDDQKKLSPSVSDISKNILETPEKHFAFVPSDTVTELHRIPNKALKVFFFHPIEGVVDNMQHLATLLNANVFGLQCSDKCEFETINDLATLYVREIRKIQNGEPYVLCGYSFGVVLAVEIAVILERLGKKVYLVCIDGSPVYVKTVVELAMKKKHVLELLASEFFTLDLNKINQLISLSADWKEQLKNTCKYISEKTHIKENDFIKTAEFLRKRMNAICLYEPRNTFNGKCTLIRRENCTWKLSESYDLEKICPHVEIVKLNADHNAILTGKHAQSIADIINKLLSGK